MFVLTDEVADLSGKTTFAGRFGECELDVDCQVIVWVTEREEPCERLLEVSDVLIVILRDVDVDVQDVPTFVKMRSWQFDT